MFWYEALPTNIEAASYLRVPSDTHNNDHDDTPLGLESCVLSERLQSLT